MKSHQVTCPKCNKPFKKFTHSYSGTVVDICQKCFSMWLDNNKLWKIFQNKSVEDQFKKIGLLDKWKTKKKCPHCLSPHNFLVDGILPKTKIVTQHCKSCNYFLLNKEGYCLSKFKETDTLKKFEFLINQDDLKYFREKDLSYAIFSMGLRELRKNVYDFLKSRKKLSIPSSTNLFSSRIKKMSQFIFKEPEIIFFGLLRIITICAVCALWFFVLTLSFGERTRGVSGLGKEGGLEFLMLWTVLCMGFVTISISFFSSCIGTVHLLNAQKKESTIITCLKLVFSKIRSICVFSVMNTLMRAELIVEKLSGSRGKYSRSITEAEETLDHSLSKPMFKSWILGTAGMLPSVITSKNSLYACQKSFEFLKLKLGDILLIKRGYKQVRTSTGIVVYIAGVFTIILLTTDQREMYGEVYTVFLYFICPLFITVTFHYIFVKPFYTLCIFELYSQYLMETQQLMAVSRRSIFSQTMNWIYIALIIFSIVLFIHQTEVNITEILFNSQ